LLVYRLGTELSLDGGSRMRTFARLIAVLGMIAVGSSALAIYDVIDTGEWPGDWPAELEPLRRQARTLVGPMVLQRHYAIPFTSREEFESAWPHLLSVKTEGAPVFLTRPPNFFLGDASSAGVIVHSPPLASDGQTPPPEVPIEGVEEMRGRWMNTTYIELVVDGEIIDLNRVPLPADTPLVDLRFESRADKPPHSAGGANGSETPPPASAAGG
jgi:hypothetical protein